MALNIVNIELDPIDTIKQIGFSLLLNCDLVLAVTDISTKNALTNIKQILPMMTNQTIILVINKVARQTQVIVSDKDISNFKQENPLISVFEISKMNKENTTQLFNKMYEILYSKASPKIYHSVSYKDIGDEFIDGATMKVCLLGNSTVGKTALIKRYFNNYFHEGMISTIGMDVQKRIIAINDIKYRFEVWDTAGQNQFRKIPAKHYNKVDGFLIIFDVSNRESFLSMKGWVDDIKKDSQPNALIYLIGNKIDKIEGREVTSQEGEDLARELDIKYFEISCKYGLNIMEIMTNMIADLYKRIEHANSSFLLFPQSYNKKKSKDRKEESEGCC